MKIRKPIQATHTELIRYRHDLHQNPGTAYEEHFAADLVRSKLKEWNIKFEDGIAETGIVATIEGHKNTSGKSLGLRADMDALDIIEQFNKPWTSRIAGKMHACGHDGHTSMLLGAAKHLKENPNFDGTVHLIFQPAEEGAGGAKKMLAEGLFKHFPCDEIYAFHNWPWLPLGQVALKPGTMMAGSSKFYLTVNGLGGHAAQPEKTIDPIVISSQIVTAVQTIVSRYTDPSKRAVMSITNFNAGTGAHNIIPAIAELVGSVRTFDMETRGVIHDHLRDIAFNLGKAMGAEIELDFETICEPTINNEKTTKAATKIAQDIVGKKNVDTLMRPFMISEDFSYMLLERPGSYIFLGQGVPNAADHPSNYGLHTPQYDFNDHLLPLGVEFWTKLVETRLPLT